MIAAGRRRYTALQVRDVLRYVSGPGVIGANLVVLHTYPGLSSGFLSLGHHRGPLIVGRKGKVRQQNGSCPGRLVTRRDPSSSASKPRTVIGMMIQWRSIDVARQNSCSCRLQVRGLSTYCLYHVVSPNEHSAMRSFWRAALKFVSKRKRMRACIELLRGAVIIERLHGSRLAKPITCEATPLCRTADAARTIQTLQSYPSFHFHKVLIARSALCSTGQSKRHTPCKSSQ
ncbi:hypothetical protein KC326_g213 [Hortaea werneckii]|nr:hypothetical protein KC326_g213 [Hortaea werneckii]